MGVAVTNPWAGGAADAGSEIPRNNKRTITGRTMNGSRVFIVQNYISRGDQIM
jgi:hypothetical protein